MKKLLAFLIILSLLVVVIESMLAEKFEQEFFF